MLAGQKWSQIFHLGQQLLLATLLFYLLYLASLYNFLFFHTLAELFSVIIAFSIFMVAWNVRQFLENYAILFLGIAFLFIGALDLVHTLAYQGMAIFQVSDPANLSTQLWIAARAMQALTLVIAPLLVSRPFRAGRVLLLYLLVTLGLLASIFYWSWFPAAYITGSGLTPFKIGTEYVIAVLLLAALWLFIRQEEHFNPNVLTWLVMSIAWTAGSEILFTWYADVYDSVNLIAHYLKIVAFYMLYRAVIHTGLTRPFELLFKTMQTSRDELRSERDFVETVLNTSYALLMVLDDQGRVVRFNRALENLTGCRQTDLQKMHLWETEAFSETAERVRDIIQRVAKSLDPVSYDGELRARDRSSLRIAWSITLQRADSEQHEYTIWTGQDVTERLQAEDELRYLSSHDSLTGLYNRAFFESEMVRLAETDHFPASVVIADVDGLKGVNDTQGHLAGDKLLQRAAHILRSAFRAQDVVARMGGDEYAVLLPDADATVAEHGLRRVQAILSAHNQVNPQSPIQISLGAATADTGYMLMEVFKQADQAMYREKHARRARGA